MALGDLRLGLLMRRTTVEPNEQKETQYPPSKSYNSAPGVGLLPP